MQNERAQSTVTVNGEQAKQELNLLETKAKRLREALIQAGKAAPSPEAEKAYSRLKKELSATDKEIRQLTKSNWDIKKVLDNVSGSSMRDLIKAQKELNVTMNKSNLDRNSDAWKQHANQLKAVKAEIALVNNETKVGQSNFMKFADWTNQTWQLFAVGAMAIMGVVNVLKKYMTMINELEDVTANLKALTGLEDKDIDKLTEWAEKMAANPLEGTGIRIRSSVEEIMAAYKLVGSAKPELLQFPEQLNEVTQKAMILSTAAAIPLADAVAGLTTSLNQYGAAAKDSTRYINALAAGSKYGAKEVPYVAEALVKFGALAKQSNIPIEQSVALIETLGAKGFQAEVAGTGIKMMFVKMMTGARDTNPAVVGMANALDNLNKKFSGPGGFNKMVDMFGEREVAIIRSLIAEREQFKSLTKAVTGTNTAIEQAQIASKTVNARLAQTSNELKILAMELFSGVSPAFLKLGNMTTVFLRVLVQLPKWLKENAGLLITLGSVMTAYTLIVNMFTIAEKAKNVAVALGVAWTKAGTIADIAAGVAKALFTGKVKEARIGMALLRAEMALNPYVAIGLLLAALTIGFYKFFTNVSDSVKAYRDFRTEAAIQTTTADQLFESLKNATIGTEERRLLIEQINSTYGQYFSNQLTEASNLNAIANAQALVNAALTKNVAMKMKGEAKEKIIKESTPKIQEYRQDLADDITRYSSKAVSDVTMKQINLFFQQNAEDLEKARNLSMELLKKINGKYVDGSIVQSLDLYKGKLKKQKEDLKEIDKQFAGELAEPINRVSVNNSYEENLSFQAKFYSEQKTLHVNSLKNGKETQLEHNAAMVRIEKDNINMLKNIKESEIKRLETAAQKELDIANSSILKNKELDKKSKEYTASGKKYLADKTNREIAETNELIRVAKLNYKNFIDQANAIKNQKPEVWVKPDTSEYADGDAGKGAATKVDPHKAQLEAIDLIFAQQQSKLKKNHEKGYSTEEKYAADMLKLTMKTLRDKQKLYFGGNQKEMLEVDKWEAAEKKKLQSQKLDKTKYFEELNKIEKEATKKRLAINKNVDKEYWDYQNQMDDLKLKSQTDADKTALEQLKLAQEARMLTETKYGNFMRQKYADMLEEDPTRQQEYNNAIMALDVALAESRLLNAQIYKEDFDKFKFKSDEERIKAEKNVNKEIEQATKDLSDAQKAILRQSIKDKKDIRREIEEIEKNLGVSDRQTKRKEYKDGLALLKTKYENELLLYKDNEKKKAEITKLYNKSKARVEAKQAQQVAEDVLAIASQASELSSKLQEVETMRIENKYAQQLKAAKGNAEETARIEAEMEAEKLALKKKYADVDFALTSAKIIASTALAVMKALETDGIAGPILAALVATTGLAELAVANEQRNAIKQLWTGGFTEPGDKYKPAGIVHAGEFVANQQAVNHSPMRKVFNLVDYAQRTNSVARITNDDIIRSLSVRAGYANGGFVSQAPAGATQNVNVDMSAVIATMRQTNAVNAALLAEIQKGINAHVSVSGNNGVAKQTDNYNKLLNNARR